MKKYLIILSVLAGMIFNPISIAAQVVEEDELEYLLFAEIPTVIVASKKAEKVTDAPGIISVITAEDIKTFGGQNLVDVLQRATNIQPMGSHLFRDNLMITRGALFNHYETHILLLLNGRPYREATGGGYDAAFYKMFPISLIERIEIIRGPGSVLYGTNAFDGVINIITKSADKDSNGEVTVGGGSFSTMTGETTIQHASDDFNIVANVNYYNSDGWDYKATTFHPVMGSMSDKMKYDDDNVSESVFLKYKDFSLNFYNSAIKMGNLGAIPVWQTTGGTGKSIYTLEWTHLDIGYTKTLFEEHDLNINWTYNRSYFDQTSLGVLSSNEAGKYYLGEISLTGPVTDQVSYVTGFKIDNYTREKLDDGTYQKQLDFDLNNWATYLQLCYQPIESLKIFTGVQYNKPEHIKAVTVPRVGLIYDFNNNTGIKIMYAEAFRAPGALETYSYYPGVILGNLNLEPEKAKTLDIQLFHNVGRIQSSLTFFTSEYKNLITRTTHPTFVPVTTTFVNASSMKTNGVEFESKFKFSKKLYFVLSAAYQEEQDNKLLTPDYMIKYGLSYDILDNLKLAVFNSRFDKSKSINSSQNLNPNAEAIDLVDINLTYTPQSLPNFSFNVWVSNALDEDYYFVEFSKGWVNTLPVKSGRAIYVKVSTKF